MGQQKKVRLFTLSTCSHCKAAKKWLTEHGIEYEFADVDVLTGSEREAALADVKKYNPHLTFPTIIIGEHVIVGNREEEMKEALEIT
jgi:glutaredoxin-like protein NrdH